MNQDIFFRILLGGLLGVLGQGLRMIPGLKKWNDDQQTNGSLATPFDVKRLTISLFIGFVAGSLASIFVFDDSAKFDLSANKKNILTLIAAGYAGVDFIEGFVQKYLPKTDAAPAAGNKATSTAVG